MLYLTPERFRTMGVGSDLDNIEEWELRSILQSASRSVDAYCNVPILPQRFIFRGGTMTDEDHEMVYNSRRVRLRARPILDCLFGPTVRDQHPVPRCQHRPPVP